MADNRRSLSLLEFCQRAKDLLASSQSDFIQLVLTGQDPDGTQACIDPVLNRVTPDDTVVAVRDYDSLLGISSRILINTNLVVFPVPKREDTLSNSVHIKYGFTTDDRTFSEDLHRIPNLCIGKWGVRNMIRALIPGLYDPHTRSPFLAQEDLTTFYELGFLPAVQELCEDRSAEWPPTYTDEMFRARGRNGALSFQTKMIPSWNVYELGSTIRSKLRVAGIPWAKGIVFLHQIRGVKDTTWHTLSEDGAEQALQQFLAVECLDQDTLSRRGLWWIDVGLEVFSESEDCLAWRTDSHAAVIQEICQVSERNSQRLTSLGSSNYTRDMISHLPQVSGCRIAPGVQGQGNYEMAYVQMYCTDKSLTYRQDQGHHGKFVTCGDIVKGRADDFIDSLYSLYINAIGNHKAHARMEVRVPLRFASTVLLGFDQDVIQGALVSFPSVEWWSLRAYRAKAIQLVLGWQAEGSWKLRSRMPSLLLTAGCAWLLNGLHSAPDNRPASRNLMDCILPEVSRRGADEMFLAYGRAIDDDDGVDTDGGYEELATLPANPHGLVFLRSLRIGQRHPVPRLTSGKVISDRSFRYFFGVDIDEIGESFFRSTRVERPELAVRSNNMTRQTRRYQGDASPTKLFYLRARGFELQAPVADDGSDLEQDSEGSGGVSEEKDIDMQLTKLWLQFISDITQKVSNRRGGDKDYCKLSAEERAAATEGVFKNLCLSHFFNDCQWKVARENEWKGVFDNLFPLEEKLGKTRNYNSTLYYRKWRTIRERAGNNKTLEAIRRALRSRFDTLLWFPCANAERIWITTSNPTRYRKFIHHSQPAPWVLCKREPSWAYWISEPGA